MIPTDCNFNLVINKGALDCVMCSSDQIERRMNMYRDEVDTVLRLVELEDEEEDGDIDNNKGEEGKGVGDCDEVGRKNGAKE